MTIPRLRCRGERPTEPGDDGFGGSGSGTATGSGKGGHLPFTGFELLLLTLSAAVLAGLGLLLQRLGRRRPVAV